MTALKISQERKFPLSGAGRVVKNSHFDATVFALAFFNSQWLC
jgi:hypothetical protein